VEDRWIGLLVTPSGYVRGKKNVTADKTVVVMGQYITATYSGDEGKGWMPK
jgi:hypothetical protein